MSVPILLLICGFPADLSIMRRLARKLIRWILSSIEARKWGIRKGALFCCAKQRAKQAKALSLESKEASRANITAGGYYFLTATKTLM